LNSNHSKHDKNHFNNQKHFISPLLINFASCSSGEGVVCVSVVECAPGGQVSGLRDVPTVPVAQPHARLHGGYLHLHQKQGEPR